MAPESYMHGLNPAQLQAVEHNPRTPLQILAGPGSGKTKVLTARIAHLISRHSVDAASICAVTFTNKAANEMRERLSKLIGSDTTSKIRMGTFHAVCVVFLRQHATLVGLNDNFTICDAEESKKIISELLKDHKRTLAATATPLTAEAMLSLISKAKAKGQSADDILDMVCTKDTKAMQTAKMKSISLLVDEVPAELYRQYERTLRRNNSLDFDDLILYGVRLFREHPKVRKWCKHILVDEFQDTSTMQYELMLHIAAENRCVTIVGDPDQSIYGWRSAEIENIGRMKKDFPSTVQILLEQNYRSTGSILAASLAIVAQDKSRIPKKLHTQCAIGPQPTLQTFPSEHAEACFVAMEIKRLVAATGGMLKWNDFVVLLRYGSLSRTIESALQKQGIPNRVLGGRKFFERMEVKDILSYLQVVDNPRFVPAFSRAINTPSRGIGEKTISEILSRAVSCNRTPLDIAEAIYDGRMPDIKPPAKRKLKSFIEPIRKLRKLASLDGEIPSKLIHILLESIQYEEYLKKTEPDADSRWKNVQELISFAREFELNESSGQQVSPNADVGRDGGDDWEDREDEFDHDAFEEDGIVELSHKTGISSKNTPLRLFLQASMLSTDVQTEEGQANNNKVTISTCHAAKGLEWPVVFIPAVEKGIFPSARAEDVEEERRLLYVACTRAQGLLYLSHSTARMVSGETKPQEVSEFVRTLGKSSTALFADKPPELTEADRTLLAAIVHRDIPDESEVARRLDEHYRAYGLTQWSSENTPSTSYHGKPRSVNGYSLGPSGTMPVVPTPHQATFSTALSYQLGTGNPRPNPRAPLSPSRPSVVNTAPIRTQPNPSKPNISKSGPLKALSRPSIQRLSAPKPGTLVSFTKSSSDDISRSSTDAPISTSSVDAISRSPDNNQSSISNVPSSDYLNVKRTPGPPKVVGVKRRLGVGHSTVGYTNKKYKPPT